MLDNLSRVRMSGCGNKDKTEQHTARKPLYNANDSIAQVISNSINSPLVTSKVQHKVSHEASQELSGFLS